jgi:hypothetical protein
MTTTVRGQNFHPNAFPTRTNGPPVGMGSAEVDLNRSMQFFKDSPDLVKYFTSFENQVDYPRNKGQEIHFYFKDFINYYYLNLNELVDEISPLRATDKLEHITTILEMEPSVANRTEERAPKEDLKGFAWSSWKTNMVLFGKGATVKYNYGDDGGYGQLQVFAQMEQQSDSINRASIFDWTVHLTTKIEDPFYAHLKNRDDGKLFTMDKVWERQAKFWDITRNTDWPQKLEAGRIAELIEQGGQAPLILITANMENFSTLYNEDHIRKDRIGEDSNGARNKSNSIGEITNLGSDYTRVKKFPDVKLEGGYSHPALQTWMIASNMYEIGVYRKGLDYSKYDLMYDKRRVTDSKNKKLGEIDVSLCLENSNLFDVADGSLLPALPDDPSKPSLISNDDLFWGKTSAGTEFTKDNFFYQFIEFDKKKPGVVVNHHTEIIVDFAKSINSSFIAYSGLTGDEIAKRWTTLRGLIKTWRLDDLTTLATWVIGAGNSRVTARPGRRETITHLRTLVAGTPAVKLAVEMIDTLREFMGILFGETNSLWSGSVGDEQIDEMLTHCGVFEKKYEYTFRAGTTVATSISVNGVTYDDTTPVNGVFAAPEILRFTPNLFGIGITSKLNSELLVEKLGPTKEFYFTPIAKRLEIVYRSSLTSCVYPLVLGYLLATIEESRCQQFYQHKIPLSWGWGFLQLRKEYITEGAIAVNTGGALLYRLIAFPEQRRAQSLVGAHYKMYFQAYLGCGIGKPSDCGFYNHMHIVKLLGGDTLTPTKLDGFVKEAGVHPEAIVIALPHFYQRPHNFSDISGAQLIGVGTSRRIPGFARHNDTWGLECETGPDGAHESLTTRKLPIDVFENQVPKCRSYMLDHEPCQQINQQTGDYEDLPGNGGTWKGVLTPTFFAERYQNKKLI